MSALPARRTGRATPAGRRWDLVVIGAGNAGLVAALAARPLVRSVLLLERSPLERRGGSTRHARNIRCVHRAAGVHNTGAYPRRDLWRDLRAATHGLGDERLAALTVARSEEIPEWMSHHGARWQPLTAAARPLGRTNRLLLGGGTALVNAYHATLARMGVTVLYGARAVELVITGDRCTAVTVHAAGRERRIPARAVVCASGGSEADRELLRARWGDAADTCIIRGSGYNDGLVLASLYAHGAAPAGRAGAFHAVPVDARAPRCDGGIATRIESIPFGILVDPGGRRFCDEGAVPPKRYAAWGHALAARPGRTVYSIWDARARACFGPPMLPPVRAGSIAELADGLGLERRALCATVARYNAAATGTAPFDPARADGLATVGLDPPKSNWARPIDAPPFEAVGVRPGITFTHRGVAVDSGARVLRSDGSAFANIFAAGAIMAGNILPTGHLSGFGLTIGTVWGRIAGTEAARVDG